MKKPNIVFPALVGALICLVLVIIAMAFSATDAGAAGNPPLLNFSYGIGGGDCSANQATGDLYKTYNNWCEVSNANSQEIAPLVVTPVFTPISVAEVSTKKPAKDSEETSQEVVPQVSETEPPAQITEKPQATQEPEDNQEPEPQPTEDSGNDTCKNKNQWKEGTEDCNAGRGNG